MDIKRHLYQHRKYQYNYVIVELSRTDLGQTFFSIWQNWNRRVFDRLFFPIGKIGVDDFLDRGFSIGKNGIDDFWIDDFQFGKWKSNFRRKNFYQGTNKIAQRQRKRIQK